MTKTALVTGSTSGIGKALAEKLASECYDLVLVSRDEGKLANQSLALSDTYGIKTYSLPLDLSTPGAAQKVFDGVESLGVSVQILVNNAGFNEAGSFLKTNATKELAMINLHVTFVTEMLKLFIPEMVEAGYGRILNLGSTGSFLPCPNDAVYAATKAYVLSLSNALNAELKGTGVTITTLCPGSTKTELARKAGIENTLLFRYFVMEPSFVADVGYKSLMKGKAATIVGLYNKATILFSKIMPAGFVNRLTARMLRA